jgi:allene oxide cyclase
MKRVLFAAALGAAATLTVVVLNAGAGGSTRLTTVSVIEHATTDAVSNHGAAGQADNVGDILTFSNEVFNAGNTSHAGHDQGMCIRTIVGVAWECMWTTFLAGGQITVEGPFYDARNSRLAVTGGTGVYSNARGWMQLNSRKGGTEYAFIFNLIR